MTQLEHRSRQPSFKGEPTASTAHRHRHPLATASLISIEAWERFSFYGMQAILVFFLYYSTTEGGIGLDKAQATALMGAYGAFLYLSTFIGGWLGDNVLGPERTLLTGAGLLVAGHGAMSFATHIPTLAVGLCLIAIGSGSLKTAAITILGAVYEQRAQVQGGLHPTTGDRIDTDRDTGFQFFYLGINIVAVAGPLLTGYLSTRYSFHVGFAAAAILMIIGVGIYLGLRRRMLAELSATTLRRISMPARPWTTTKVLGIGGAGLGGTCPGGLLCCRRPACAVVAGALFAHRYPVCRPCTVCGHVLFNVCDCLRKAHHGWLPSHFLRGLRFPIGDQSNLWRSRGVLRPPARQEHPRL